MRKIVIILIIMIMISGTISGQNATREQRDSAISRDGVLGQRLGVPTTNMREQSIVEQPQVEVAEQITEIQTPPPPVEIREQRVESPPPPPPPPSTPPPTQTDLRDQRQTNVQSIEQPNTPNLEHNQGLRDDRREQTVAPPRPSTPPRQETTVPNNQGLRSEGVTRNRELEQRTLSNETVANPTLREELGVASPRPTPQEPRERRSLFRRNDNNRRSERNNVRNHQSMPQHIPNHSMSPFYNEFHQPHIVQENIFIMRDDHRQHNDLFMARHYYWSWELINLSPTQRQTIANLQAQLLSNLANQRELLWRLELEKREDEKRYNFGALRLNSEAALVVERNMMNLKVDFQQAVYEILTTEQRNEYLRMRDPEYR